MNPDPRMFGRRGGFLITGALTLSGPADIWIDETGRIGAAGEGVAKEYRGGVAEEIEGSGMIALPGLVNTHTHAAMTLLRGYADDMPLQAWLAEKIWPLEAHLTPRDVYWGTKLACLEMIRTGTTAFNDMYFHMEEAARAVDEAGLRAVLAHGFIDLSLPEKREAECRATEKLAAAIRSMANPRIRAAAGPHAVYTASPDGLRWLAGFAAEEDIGIHIHLSETRKEVDDCLAAHGMRPPQLLEECGVLTRRTLAAHCCWLDEGDAGLLARHGTSVSYNPASNMKLAVGRALPYQMLRDRGVRVALGTDGCASNNNLDLFEEMKTGALLQKFAWDSQTTLPAHEALRMAGPAGAEALGLGATGIAAGQPADLCLVGLSTPCNTPLHHLESNLVYACSGSAVRTVFCDGRLLMHDGWIPGEAAILEGAAKAAFALVKRAAQG
jgi:5-methylthioadenosine/S-adenosylhomocysteine deaminase